MWMAGSWLDGGINGLIWRSIVQHMFNEVSNAVTSLIMMTDTPRPDDESNLLFQRYILDD